MNTVGIILLIILGLFLLTLLFCLFIKIRLVIALSKRESGKLKANLSLEIFGGKIKKTIPLAHKKAKAAKATTAKIEEADEKLSFFQKVKKYYGIFLRLSHTWSKSKRAVRKKILAEKIYLNLSFGTGDAASTGILVGSLWGAIYNVIAFVSNFIRVTEPDMSINPSYDEELLDFEFECILKVSVANIISIISTLYINYYFADRKQTKKEKAAINNVNTN